ncbi:hypothetical protein [Clostridium oceanicum]|uniref:CHAD domain-containing protein n=1 Tax=Clostridium oceanicum TaxID=1543 RepID=A0ABN1JAQ6_9CLOT
MKRNDMKKFICALERIEKDLIDENEVTSNIKKRLKRIIYEVEFCISNFKKNKYFAIQQFRPLMDKIVNVILLRDYKKRYLKYMECLKEFIEIESKREYLSRCKIKSRYLKDKEKFMKRKLDNLEISIENIRNYKFEKFQYSIGYLCNDSSRVIHDDNSTYDVNSDNIKRTVKEVEEIILFFVSNIFISLCENEKDKNYLRIIHKNSKKNLKNNYSIKKKSLKKLKKELRGTYNNCA